MRTSSLNSVVCLGLLICGSCLKSIQSRPTSRVHFNSNDDEARGKGILRNFQRKRDSSILQINLQEYLARTGGGELSRDIVFPTDEDRDLEFRNRLTTSERPLELLEPPSDSESLNFLPLPNSPSYFENNNPNPSDLRENSAELVSSFLEWARAQEQEEPLSLIPTFNTTRNFGQAQAQEEGTSTKSSGVGWSLTVGTGLGCPDDHAKGRDGICRPRVLF